MAALDSKGLLIALLSKLDSSTRAVWCLLVAMSPVVKATKEAAIVDAGTEPNEFIPVGSMLEMPEVPLLTYPSLGGQLPSFSPATAEFLLLLRRWRMIYADATAAIAAHPTPTPSPIASARLLLLLLVSVLLSSTPSPRMISVSTGEFEGELFEADADATGPPSSK